ncbi:MAG: hypothetical protein ACTSRS_11720 [Candidatus Helarchaeota archaeon]
MKYRYKIGLALVCLWLVLAIVPLKTSALYPNSFNQTETDYFFLKFTEVNNATSLVTNFALPPVDTNWMIEVTSLLDGPPSDNLSGQIYQDTGSFLDLWQDTPVFGAGEHAFGTYNGSTFTIDPTFETIFPVPFIVPTDWYAVFNQTLNQSLTSTHHFDHYQFMNLSGLIPAELSGLLPVQPIGLIVAWNGSFIWFEDNASGRMEPYGNVTSNKMLVALYFEDGELNYLTENWWDNTTQEWKLAYKLKSPLMELIGGMLEAMIPGSGVSGSDMSGIPGFEFSLLFIGIIVALGITSYKKQKNQKPKF